MYQLPTDITQAVRSSITFQRKIGNNTLIEDQASEIVEVLGNDLLHTFLLGINIYLEQPEEYEVMLGGRIVDFSMERNLGINSIEDRANWLLAGIISCAMDGLPTAFIPKEELKSIRDFLNELFGSPQPGDTIH